MKCPECGADCERGMRLTFRLITILHSGRTVHYMCATPGVSGHINFPTSDDAPAPELTVYVEGVG